jgi:hypothetical protein
MFCTGHDLPEEQTSSVCLGVRPQEKLSKIAFIFVTFRLSATTKFLVSFLVDISYEFYVTVSYIDLSSVYSVSIVPTGILRLP